MPAVYSTSIVYNHNGTGIRHHHSGTPNYGMENIIRERHRVDRVNYAPHQPPNEVSVQVLLRETARDGLEVKFAFASIVRNIDDNHLYTDVDPNNQSVFVTVGAVDVDVLIVYTPPGGIVLRDGEPGVWVDAFDVDTQQLSDAPTFMQVFTLPPPPNSVDITSTNRANGEGEISTITAKNMRADASIDGLFFLKWKQIMPVQRIVSSRDVSLTENESGEIWFAFYQGFKDVAGPPPVPYGEIYEITPGVWLKLPWGLGGWQEPGGVGDPHPEWSMLPAKLLSTLVILSIASNMSKEVKAEAIKLAIKNLNSIAESIKENGDKLMQ